MLVAVAADGARRVASGDGAGQSFRCPDCGERLVVRLPRNRVAHFAHLPGRRCQTAAVRALRRAEARRRAAQQRALARAQAAEVAGQQALFDLAAD